AEVQLALRAGLAVSNPHRGRGGAAVTAALGTEPVQGAVRDHHAAPLQQHPDLDHRQPGLHLRLDLGAAGLQPLPPHPLPTPPRPAAPARGAPPRALARTPRRPPPPPPPRGPPPPPPPPAHPGGRSCGPPPPARPPGAAQHRPATPGAPHGSQSRQPPGMPSP